MRLEPSEIATLMQGAAHGDQRSWDALVHEFGGMIWAIARSYGLSAAEAADVSQTTWLRLCENIDRLRDPAAAGAWLATTARRESASLLDRSRLIVPLDDLVLLGSGVDESEIVEAHLLREDAVAAVRQAVERLPLKTQQLLGMLMQDRPPSYEQVSVVLQLPIGSIGPTRGRALRRLRRILENGQGPGASTA